MGQIELEIKVLTKEVRRTQITPIPCFGRFSLIRKLRSG